MYVSCSRVWLRSIAAALALATVLLLPSAGEAADPCPLVGVRIRNDTCESLSHGVLGAFREGKQVGLWCLGTVCGGESATRTGQPVAADRVYLHFCTKPGLGLQAVIPSQGPKGRARSIRSVFVHASCCPGASSVLAYFHDDGPTVRVPLMEASGPCHGAKLCKVPDVRPVRQGEPAGVARAAPGSGGAGFDDEGDDTFGWPFQVFRVRNNHPSRRIVRARARPFDGTKALPTITHTQIGSPPAPPNEKQGSINEDADKVIVSLCVDDATAVQAWTAEKAAGQWILSITVTLQADGQILLEGQTHQEEALTFTPIASPEPSDACPRWESFQVVNQHPNLAVVRARAVPTADGHESAALVVDNVAKVNGTKTTPASTNSQHEASSVTVSLCMQDAPNAIVRTISTNDPAARIRTVTATVTRNAQGQTVLTLTATTLPAGAPVTQSPPTSGTCPLP